LTFLARILTTLSRTLGITVFAEGIERGAELATLQAAGIRLFQGYLFARPALARLPEVNFTASEAASIDPTAQVQAA